MCFSLLWIPQISSVCFFCSAVPLIHSTTHVLSSTDLTVFLPVQIICNSTLGSLQFGFYVFSFLKCSVGSGDLSKEFASAPTLVLHHVITGQG